MNALEAILLVTEPLKSNLSIYTLSNGSESFSIQKTSTDVVLEDSILGNPLQPP